MLEFDGRRNAMASNLYQDVSYAALRFLAGGLFAFHGAQKLFGLFGGKVMTDSPKMLAAGIIELGGGLLIAFGLFAIVAAFVASGEMAVAYFTVHAKGGLWPILNGGELAVLYCFVFFYIVWQGPGRFSLDRLIRRKK
jgi:putative oxidoreductase